MRALIVFVCSMPLVAAAAGVLPAPVPPSGVTIVPNVFPNGCRALGGAWDLHSMRCYVSEESCRSSGGYWVTSTQSCTIGTPRAPVEG